MHVGWRKNEPGKEHQSWITLGGVAATPSVEIVRRLAFAKYIYSLGVDQSRLPEPMNTAALLQFHDAAELFMQIASEYLDVGKSQIGFTEYWDLLQPKLPEPISQKESMRRLNKARVAMKHHGTLPSTTDMGSFRETATRFLEENTPRIFGIPFATISLIEFVATPAAKESLAAAIGARQAGKLDDAIGYIALAFRQVLDSYEDPKMRQASSPFFFGQDLTFMSSSLLKVDRSKEPKLAAFIDSVRESIMALQNATKMLSLGIDYRRYSRFQMHTPNVMRMMDQSYRVTFRVPRLFEMTGDDVEFCFNFVIETALALQGFDYATPDYARGKRRERMASSGRLTLV